MEDRVCKSKFFFHAVSDKDKSSIIVMYILIPQIQLPTRDFETILQTKLSLTNTDDAPNTMASFKLHQRCNYYKKMLKQYEKTVDINCNVATFFLQDRYKSPHSCKSHALSPINLDVNFKT